MKKISVIVPMYNCEAFIEKCIHSLLNQTYDNLEIIIIDDGSTDSSYAICSALAENDSRVHLLQQVNSGVSAARNAGLKYATGDYIGFVDSDDYVTSEMFAALNEAAEKNQADIVECGYFKADINGQVTLTVTFEADVIHNNQEMMKKAFLGWNTEDFCCNKLYARALFNDVKFPGFHYSEDYYVNYRVMAKSQTKVTIAEPHYYYVQHDSNATSGNFNDKKMDVINAGEAVLSLVEKDFPLLKDYAIIYLLENLRYLYLLTLSGDKSNIRKNAPVKDIILNKFKYYNDELANAQNVSLKDKIKFSSFRYLPETSLKFFQLFRKLRERQ